MSKNLTIGAHSFKNIIPAVPLGNDHSLDNPAITDRNWPRTASRLITNGTSGISSSSVFHYWCVSIIKIPYLVDMCGEAACDP